MPAIALIDDRKSDRDTIARVLKSTLKKLGKADTWEVVAESPPHNSSDILSWLDEHHATVLVADWRLNEGAANKRIANYEADALVNEIRTRRPSFPVFIVTGFPQDAEVHLGKVEGVCVRAEFAKRAATLVPQIMRAGQRRHEEFGRQWAEWDRLTRRVASGRASPSAKKRFNELSGLLQAEFPGVNELDGVLSELETFKKKAQALKRKLVKKQKSARKQ